MSVCDLDDTAADWRSKFSRHEIVTAEVDGTNTRVLRLPHDLSQAPHYDWVRVLRPNGIDVRPFTFLSVRLWSDGSPVRATTMLMQTTERTQRHRHGEIVAHANRRPIDLDFKGWKQFSIPLSGFGGLGDIAEEIHQFNIGLGDIRGREQRPGVLMIADLTLTSHPRGQLVEERVPYPPADIAIPDAASFFALLDLERPELQAVKDAVRTQDWQAAKVAWAQHLKQRTTPRWTWSHRDRDRIVSIYEERFGGLDGTVAAADRVMRREFSWLGVRKQLERDIEWLHGPIEWTHVLSRHQYWRSMGLAWWATGNAKYAEDWVYMLHDWIEDNPVPRILTNARGKHGTVWRTLETGIRGDLWFDVMEMFMEAPAFDAQAKYEMTRSLVEQARHLHRYTVAFRHGNWQVVECTGLACIGIMLPEFREASDWRERAFDYLVQHMERDVYPDGAHHELTPGYHGWVMERFLKASLLATANGYEITGLMARHEKMFEFLMHVSQPNGLYPPLGDAGRGGRIAGNMGLGALLYGREDMRYLATDSIQSRWVWLFPPDVLDEYPNLPARKPSFTSHMMPHAQYGMMRTGWHPRDRSLLFDCAPWGGGHSHQDRLQVILYAGRNLLVDPGVYSYDQPLTTQYFRKAEAHNILLIDEKGQPESDPEVLAWTVTEQAEFASGRIQSNGITHQRSVLFVKPHYWVVVDHVTGQGSHALTRLFHFPDTDVHSEALAARTRFDGGTNVWVAHAGDAELEMREGWLPAGGAKAIKAPVAAFVTQGTLPATLCSVLVPFDGPGDIPTVTRIGDATSSTMSLRLDFPDGRTHWIAVAPETAQLAAGEHEGSGIALCVRQNKDRNIVDLLQPHPLDKTP